jgi:hypothetical protein
MKRISRALWALPPLAALAACAQILGFEELRAPAPVADAAADAGAEPEPTCVAPDSSTTTICGQLVTRGQDTDAALKTLNFIADSVEYLKTEAVDIDGIDTRGPTSRSCIGVGEGPFDGDGGADNAFGVSAFAPFFVKILNDAIGTKLYSLGLRLENVQPNGGVRAFARLLAVRKTLDAGWTRYESALLDTWSERQMFRAEGTEPITVFFPGREQDSWLVPLAIQRPVIAGCLRSADGGLGLVADGGGPREDLAPGDRISFVLSGALRIDEALRAISYVATGTGENLACSFIPEATNQVRSFCASPDIGVLGRPGKSELSCDLLTPCNAISISLKLNGYFEQKAPPIGPALGSPFDSGACDAEFKCP